MPLLVHPGVDPTSRKLPLYTSHGLENVLEGVQVVKRTLPLSPGELELGHFAEQCRHVTWGCECLVEGHVYGSSAGGGVPPFYG